MSQEDRNAKRAKVNHDEPSPVTMVTSEAIGTVLPLTLVKTRPSIFSSDQFPSPGYLQSSRVAAKHLDDGGLQIYFASQENIYTMAYKGSHMDCIRGKEGMLLPSLMGNNESVESFFTKGVSELQALTLSSHLTLGAIDSRGRIYCFDTHKGISLSPLAPPTSLSSSEEGWTGLAFSPHDHSSLAATTHQGKCLSIYKLDLSSGAEHTWHTVMGPSALCWAGEGLVAAAEEGRGISLWDPRSPSACHTVILPHNSSSSETIHSLNWIPPVPGGLGFNQVGGGVNPSSSSMGLLASAGTDRTVQFFDPRKWQAVGRWGGLAKYAITGAMFSALDPRYCYLQSLDYELTCGRWEPNASNAGPVRGNTNSQSGAGHGRAVGPSLKVHPAMNKSASCVSFRGDSRWLGMAIARGDNTSCWDQARESILAYAQSGSIFIMENTFN